MNENIAVLVMAYGGPDELEDIEAYLRKVRGGRTVPTHVLEAVKKRYALIGGSSPILEETKAQAQVLQKELARGAGIFRTFVGMRHWHPFIEETIKEIAESGLSKLVGLVMSPHYSRMSVGAYGQRLAQAVAALPQPMETELIKSWKDDPGYLDVFEARIGQGLAKFEEEARSEVHLIFTAHSLPERIKEWQDPYPQELRCSLEKLRERFAGQPMSFAYQSAPRTRDPWLGPDAGELMKDLMEKGIEKFLVAPIGFVCKHVEILFDIDIKYREQVEAAGGQLERIEMPGADSRMMASLAKRVRSAAKKRGWL